jgi:hypothetical protein
VFNELWTPQIIEAGRKSLHHVDRTVRRPKKQRSGVGRDRSAVKGRHHFAPFDGFKSEQLRGTLCRHRGVPRISGKWLLARQFSLIRRPDALVV